LGRFCKQRVLIIAVKGGRVKYLNTVLNVTALYCSDR